MNYLTNDKLVIVGAGGMIGSNMAQTALMLKLTPNICLYDVYEPGLLGVVAEMNHCAFEGANITWTTDPAVAFKDAKYIISSGGAPRKEGMTREDLLKGNCQIAEDFGKNVKKYCPDVRHIVVIFNPADLTGLVVLLHSGLAPEKVTTLAALDSTRLQTALAQKFGVPQSKVTGAMTYGGHGEAMAVFASQAKNRRQAPLPDGPERRRVRPNQAGNRPGRLQYHQAARPFFLPEPGLQRREDDRGGDGW